MIYTAFLPNYYSTLIKAQQQSIIIDNLYFFVADGVTKDAVANDSPKTVKDEQVTINQILYGAKLMPSNLIPMCRKIPWQYGKIFTQYSSTDPNLNVKDFFCVNSNGAVYKCLDNNGNSPSLEQPTTLIPGAFKQSDGYTWIYLFKVSENEMLNYSYEDLMPLIVDPNVTSATQRGTISTIDVETPGNYKEYHNGYVQGIVSNNMVRIEDSASKHTGAYNSMGFYIQSGPGQGEIKQISNYVSNSSGNYVTLSTNLDTAGLGSQYDIAPYVKISGNGSGGSARSILTGEAVTKIEILNRGAEYTLANAELLANTVYSTPGTVNVNLSPPKGHGGDIYQELYINDVLINIEFDNYIIENLPTDEITFSKVGFIRGILDENTLTLYNEPTFNNTFTASIPTVDSQFEVGDIIRPFNAPAPLAQIVYANTTHVIGVYQTPFLRYTLGMTLVNQNNVQGTVIDITQPQVKFIGTDVVCQVNTNTVQRDENSRELFIILNKIR